MQYTQADLEAAIKVFRDTGQQYNIAAFMCPECGGAAVFAVLTPTLKENPENAAIVGSHRRAVRAELSEHLLNHP